MTSTTDPSTRPVSKQSDGTFVNEDSPHSTFKSVGAGGEGESAIPEDKKEEALENAEDDWAHDERNPRNWKASKKWTAVCGFFYVGHGQLCLDMC